MSGSPGEATPRLAPSTVAALRSVFDATPQLRQVWLFGSWARGDARRASDIDLAVDAPALDARGFAALTGRVEALGLLRRVDLVHWQALDPEPALRGQIERDRRLFWPTMQASPLEATPCPAVMNRSTTRSKT